MQTSKKNEGFGRRLRQLRGITQQTQVAKELGITQSMLSRYEKGTLPEADILLKVVQKYGVEYVWLLTGEQPEKGTRLTAEGEGIPVTEKEVAPALAYVIDVVKRAFTATLGEYQDELVRDLIDLVNKKKG